MARFPLESPDHAARSDTSLLLIGETGVGKELFTDYVHRVTQAAKMLGLSLSLRDKLKKFGLDGEEQGRPN